MQYRFEKWKDASWNSFERQQARYEVLKPHLGQGLTGAEIGVYKGGFGEFLLPHCKKLYLCDSWYRGGGFWDSGLKDDSRVTTVIDILTVYKSEIETGRVEVVVEYSNVFLRSKPDGYFDFLYIDASHKYQPTLREIRLAHKKLRPGGKLFGDDYDPDPKSKQHGVFRAVNDFARQNGGKLILNKARQWGLAFDGSAPATTP